VKPHNLLLEVTQNALVVLVLVWVVVQQQHSWAAPQAAQSSK